MEIFRSTLAHAWELSMQCNPKIELIVSVCAGSLYIVCELNLNYSLPNPYPAHVLSNPQSQSVRVIGKWRQWHLHRNSPPLMH